MPLCIGAKGYEKEIYGDAGSALGVRWHIWWCATEICTVCALAQILTNISLSNSFQIVSPSGSKPKLCDITMETENDPLIPSAPVQHLDESQINLDELQNNMDNHPYCDEGTMDTQGQEGATGQSSNPIGTSNYQDDTSCDSGNTNSHQSDTSIPEITGKTNGVSVPLGDTGSPDIPDDTRGPDIQGDTSALDTIAKATGISSPIGNTNSIDATTGASFPDNHQAQNNSALETATDTVGGASCPNCQSGAVAPPTYRESLSHPILDSSASHVSYQTGSEGVPEEVWSELCNA